MKTFYDLQEGVYDPNILKAFFLAGGPGSGKSYVIQRTTGGLGMKIVNSDNALEKLLKDAGLSLKMPPEEEEPRTAVRFRAKELTAKRQANYVEGRLGLIIDGTGKTLNQIMIDRHYGVEYHGQSKQDIAEEHLKNRRLIIL